MTDKMPDEIWVFPNAASIGDKGFTVTKPEDGYQKYTRADAAAILIAGLESIAANSCCDKCQEAKLVAQSTLDKYRADATKPGAEIFGECEHCGEVSDLHRILCGQKVCPSCEVYSEASRMPETVTLISGDYEEVLVDHRRLVHELDVLLCGEEHAAKAASLCDIISMVASRVRETGVPLMQSSLTNTPAAKVDVDLGDTNKYFGIVRLWKCWKIFLA